MTSSEKHVSASLKSTSRKSAAHEPTEQKSAAPKSAAPKSAAQKSVAPKSVAPKSVAPKSVAQKPAAPKSALEVRVRRIHRRDLNRTWEFLKLVFREVNQRTVEYQRPRSKRRFFEVYDEEGIEQLLFVIGTTRPETIVGYAECAYEISGSDNFFNERYFRRNEMRPLFVEELAVHPDFQGRGLGSFMLEQVEHLAKLRGCTHIVLEVAENNPRAMKFYQAREFQKLDAAVFLARKVSTHPDLLPARTLKSLPQATSAPSEAKSAARPARRKDAAATAKTAPTKKTLD
jgi:ribosomal protein S18 acetylase RimI-like enzyme